MLLLSNYIKKCLIIIHKLFKSSFNEIFFVIHIKFSNKGNDGKPGRKKNLMGKDGKDVIK